MTTTSSEPSTPPSDGGSAAPCTFALRTLERIDAKPGRARLRVSGALVTPGSTKAPLLLCVDGAQRSELSPVWTARQGSSWTAEYAAAAEQVGESGVSLALALPDGRLVDLPAPAPLAARRRARTRTRSVGFGLAACAVLALIGWGAASAIREQQPAVAPPPRPAPAGAPAPAKPAARPSLRDTVANTPPGTRLVARAVTRRVGLYRSPTATRAWTFVRNPNTMRAPAVFLVEAAAEDRLKVALPIRPNGSSAWIRAVDVRLSRVEHRVDVDLTRHRVTVRRRGEVVARSAAGVGRSLTPTPSGTYYVIALLQQPDPTGIYGPYAFALSGHSPVLDEFAGGNGRIGLHGTNEPSGIGADVSHGCIRVPNAFIRRLARMLPLGTPVRITR